LQTEISVRAAEFLEVAGVDTPRASVTRLTNPHASLLEIFIEPLASTLFLLPHREYAVISEAADEHGTGDASIELGDPITVWAEGTAGNRIFRDDGNLVWDDAEPSNVHPIIPTRLIQPLLDWARANPHSSPKELRKFLESELAPEEMRSDLPLLIVEHGLLSMDGQGNVFDPRVKL
jgi:hypothetical protein